MRGKGSRDFYKNPLDSAHGSDPCQVSPRAGMDRGIYGKRQKKEIIYPVGAWGSACWFYIGSPVICEEREPRRDIENFFFVDSLFVHQVFCYDNTGMQMIAIHKRIDLVFPD